MKTATPVDLLRFALSVTLVAISLALTSCTLLLDLPADCTPEDCSGFICNAQKTECLFSCINDDQCSEGFICNDTTNGTCVAAGCSPDTALANFFEGTSSVQNVALATNGDNTELFAAFNKSNNDLVAQRYANDGTPIASPLMLESFDLKPSLPSVAWNGAGWGVVWEATGPVGDPGNTRIREFLRFAFVTLDGVVLHSDVTLWIPDNRQDQNTVDAPSITWDPKSERFVIVWATRFEFVRNLFMLSVTPEGTSVSTGEAPVPHEEAIQISLTDDDTFSPEITLREQPGVQPNLFDVTYQEGSTRIALILRTLDINGQKVIGDDVNISLNEDNSQITSYGYVAISTGSVAAFSESAPGTEASSFRTQILGNREVALGADGQSRFEVDSTLVNAKNADVTTTSNDEYAIIVSATKRDRDGIYLARFNDNGANIGAAFEVSSLDSEEPSQPRVFGLGDSYFVFYKDGRLGAVGQRWRCQ